MLPFLHQTAKPPSENCLISSGHRERKDREHSVGLLPRETANAPEGWPDVPVPDMKDGLSLDRTKDDIPSHFIFK